MGKPLMMIAGQQGSATAVDRINYRFGQTGNLPRKSHSHPAPEYCKDPIQP